MINNKLDIRLNIYAITNNDEDKKHLENRIHTFQLCKDDWKFFVNNFVWIQDPEADTPEKKDLPFLLYDFQEKAGDEIVKAIVNGYDLPIEKSRKMGLTWLVLAILLWGWHFHKWDCLVGSRKFEEVDKRGDMGTLFQKFRYMIERLPKWIFTKELSHYTDKVGMIMHPEHKSTLAGEANSPDFGRSDRRKVAFLDEFTSWEQTDRAAWQAVSATTKCRLPVSTPNRRGTNCWFYQVIKDNRKKNKPFLTLDWTLHPFFSKDIRDTTDKDKAKTLFLMEKTSPWLENEIVRASDKQSVAQEILINYEASMSGKVFPDFDIETQVVDDLKYNENLPLYVTWDFGLDATSMIWIQYDREKNLFYVIDEYENSGQHGGSATEIYHYLDILNSKPYKSAIHYGDPNSGNSRNIQSGQSIATILRRQGIRFSARNIKSKIDRIQAARNILRQFRISSNCTLTIEMLTSWQMVQPRSGNTVSETPAHDENSHNGDAFSYFAWNFAARKVKTNNNKKKYTPTSSGVMY